MALDLANYKEQARDAIKAFWGNREAAARKQAETGNIDMGTRGAVTAGSRCAAADTSGIASPGLVTSRIGVVAALGGALSAGSPPMAGTPSR